MKRPMLIGTCTEEQTRLSMKTIVNDSNPAWTFFCQRKIVRASKKICPTFVCLLFCQLSSRSTKFTYNLGFFYSILKSTFLFSQLFGFQEGLPCCFCCFLIF